MSGTTLTREEVLEQINDLRAALASLEATQVVSTAPQTCGRATLQGTPCTRPATLGDTCKQHTPEAITARDLRVAQQDVQRSDFLARRDAFLSQRATQVRDVLARSGALEVLVKHNRTVTQRSRRDLASLGVRGLSKTMPAREVLARAEAMAVACAPVWAISGEAVDVTTL